MGPTTPLEHAASVSHNTLVISPPSPILTLGVAAKLAESDPSIPTHPTEIQCVIEGREVRGRPYALVFGHRLGSIVACTSARLVRQLAGNACCKARGAAHPMLSLSQLTITYRRLRKLPRSTRDRWCTCVIRQGRLRCL